MIISIGMATIAEIDDAVTAAARPVAKPVLLKCTSNYPASPDNQRPTVPHLRELFGRAACPITMGSALAIAARPRRFGGRNTLLRVPTAV